VPAANLLKLAGLIPSTSEARRAIQQGGAYLGPDKVNIESVDQPITVTDGLLLGVGKKRFGQVRLVD
jgi:tyrosyl-tRNA synthetase